MSRLEKYPAYKDSGIEWIGKIPAHWKIQKGKHLFKQVKRPIREQDEIVTCFRDGVVTLRSNRRTEGFTNALKEFGYQGVRKGDFVIHNMDAFAGAIGISDSDGKSTPVYSVCRPLDENLVLSQYYAQYLRNLALQDFISSLAKGIRERSTDFRFKDFGELEYPLPPKEEQERIAAFLDTKTAQIDTAISQKEKFIELLKEYKQTIINEAVTKGLDKNAPLKDSGIEWIGKIPAHWEVKKLKYTLKFVTGATPPSGEEKYYIEEEPWVTIADMNGKYINKHHFISKKAVKECNMQIVPKESLLYSFKLSVGQVAFATQDTYTNEAIASFYPANNINLHFWYYVLPIFVIKNANKNIYGAYLLNNYLIKNATIIFPPKQEQERIAAFLDAKTAQINTAINLQQQSITTLKEYKQILIDSVVTGKMRVSQC